MSRREELLEGKLCFPRQIMQYLNVTTDQRELIKTFWNTLWHNYLREKDTDTVSWYKKFSNHLALFDRLLFILSSYGWINSYTYSSWASVNINENKLLKYLNKEELVELKRKYKINKYKLTNSTSSLYNVVQTTSSIRRTGLNRIGFMKAGNNTFKYDRDVLKKYVKEISFILMKDLAQSYKDITYQECIDLLMNYYIQYDNTYSLGTCLIDSRGRAIFEATRKVFNPIGSKEARSLIQYPEPISLSPEDMKHVLAFITSLNGIKVSSFESAVEAGDILYRKYTLPESTPTNLYKCIWLERIYNNLIEYNGNNWTVPIEIDACCSFLQFIGILLNEHSYIRGTNLAYTDTYQDIWQIEGVPRSHTKCVIMPQLYGSTATAKQLLDEEGLKYTSKQLKKLNNTLTNGVFTVANDFKEFVLKHVNPKPEMNINIWQDSFTIECNRYNADETFYRQYRIWDSNRQNIATIPRKEYNIDLKQFRRYFITLLVHNLDSQVANAICSKVPWVLPNHDSFITTPNHISAIQDKYRYLMSQIYTSRKEILSQYFASIGINKQYREDTSEMLQLTTHGLK